MIITDWDYGNMHLLYNVLVELKAIFYSDTYLSIQGSFNTEASDL